MRSGIYSITNRTNGKRYIGSSKDVDARIADHIGSLRSGKHRNAKLQNAWNSYGEANFEFRMIIACSRENLELYEQISIDGLGAYFKAGGYNLRPIAFSNKGRPGSERQKAVTRDRLKGTKNPILTTVLARPERKQASRAKLNSIRRDPEIEARRAAAIRAHYADPAVRARQASYVKGIKRSPETIQKLSAVQSEVAAKKRDAGYRHPQGPDGRFLPGGNTALGAMLGQGPQ